MSVDHHPVLFPGVVMRAVIYTRYSSDQQRDASIDDQIRICKERVAAEGWQLVQVYRDAAFSGATTLRPGYQALLEGAREAAFDVVVAEALDRLSRDQEDVAALFKRLQYAGIRLITLGEGEISALHVGLKGTMNALFLKDLADKVRRGLRGRVDAGKSGGGNAYGYTVVRQLDAAGEPIRGDRSINAAEAEVVRGIFREFAVGKSPRAIALALNHEGILGPRGGLWSPSTIYGNRARGTGILNNEAYIGRLIWNRLRYIKDPESGRRRSRANADAAVTMVEVPELRILTDAEWEAVKARQSSLDRDAAARDGLQSSAPAPAKPFWSKQRPRYLFSGLMQCGCCGGGFSKISQDHFGCSTARNKGPTACTNRIGIRRDVLEATVLDGLRNRLMDPELFKAFAGAFTAEWNKQQGASAATQDGLRAERHKITQQMERLVDAIADGTPPSVVNKRLAELEQRQQSLDTKLAETVAPAPRLHPNLAEVYRRKVATLADALGAENGAEAREVVRGLIDAIVL
ncbi:MAG: recombinase family protein, partial [Rhodospirillales bacterium]|nr:recombinase family protein [Rhodospirillales bacterium]